MSRRPGGNHTLFPRRGWWNGWQVLWEEGKEADAREPLAAGMEADLSLSSFSRLCQRQMGLVLAFQHLSVTPAEPEDREEVTASEGTPADEGLPMSQGFLSPSPAG